MKKCIIGFIAVLLLAMVASFSIGAEKIGWGLGFVLVSVLGIWGATYSPKTSDYIQGKRKA